MRFINSSVSRLVFATFVTMVTLCPLYAQDAAPTISDMTRELGRGLGEGLGNKIVPTSPTTPATRNDHQFEHPAGHAHPPGRALGHEKKQRYHHYCAKRHPHDEKSYKACMKHKKKSKKHGHDE